MISNVIPSNVELATFLCGDLGLNHQSFGLNELAGRSILQSLQYRMMNIMLCVKNGIPLSRTNRPGKNSTWVRSITNEDRALLHDNNHLLRPVRMPHRNKPPDRQNHYPLPELRQSVINNAYDYQRNASFHMEYNDRRNHNLNQYREGGTLNPIKVEDIDKADHPVATSSHNVTVTMASSLVNQKIRSDETSSTVNPTDDISASVLAQRQNTCTGVTPTTTPTMTERNSSSNDSSVNRRSAGDSATAEKERRALSSIWVNQLEYFSCDTDLAQQRAITNDFILNLPMYIRRKFAELPEDTSRSRRTGYWRSLVPPQDSDSKEYKEIVDHCKRGRTVDRFPELYSMMCLPDLGARALWSQHNPLVYQKNVKKMLLQCELTTNETIPSWVVSLPENHPCMLSINSVSQQIQYRLYDQLRENAHSLIPQFPDFVFPPHAMKWVEVFMMECPLWDIGLVTMRKSIEEIQNNDSPTSPVQCYRCICPLSYKLKPWMDEKGLTPFFDHGAVQPCRHKVFQNPMALIDHVFETSKTCTFHFLIGQVIRELYQDANKSLT